MYDTGKIVTGLVVFGVLMVLMSRGCDFMLYFIADAMVDDYLPILVISQERNRVIQFSAPKPFP